MKQKLNVMKTDDYLINSSLATELINELNCANNLIDDEAIHFEEICKKFQPTNIIGNNVESVLSLKKSFVGLFTTKVLINGLEATVLLDTGAEISVMSDSILRDSRVKWNRSDRIGVNSFNDTSEDMEVASVEQVQMGNMRISNLPVLVMDYKKMRFRILGLNIFRIDGVIGWDVLSRCNFELDYKNLEFRVITTGLSFGAIMPSTSFPTILLGADGELRPYGFDTGASKSWISQKVIDRNNLEVVTTKNRTIRGAHGREVELTKVIRKHSVSLCDYYLEFNYIRTGYTEYLNDYELDGVLGSDILREHIIRMDNIAGVCRLLP